MSIGDNEYKKMKFGTHEVYAVKSYGYEYRDEIDCGGYPIEPIQIFEMKEKHCYLVDNAGIIWISLAHVDPRYTKEYDNNMLKDGLMVLHRPCCRYCVYTIASREEKRPSEVYDYLLPYLSKGWTS